jgi:hypothetical protein
MRQLVSYLAAATLALGACHEPGTQPSESPLADASSDPSLAAAISTAGRIYGVDDANFLVRFRADRPGTLQRRVRITGTGSERIVSIDFRPSAVAPADPSVIGKLYGLTSTRVYEIDPGTGAAINARPLSVALRGGQFGGGFNPTVDRFRSHSNANQNVRLNVADGVTAKDTALAYASGDLNAGRDPQIAGTGYTNSDNDPITATQLYAIDAAQDALVLLPSPNSGQLTTVGRLGMNTDGFVGFDIPGATGTAFGFASLRNSAENDSRSGVGLYRVDLATGRAQRIGSIGGPRPLVSIAVEP